MTCAEDGSEKYILGPAELAGTDVKGATRRPADQQPGRPDRPRGRST